MPTKPALTPFVFAEDTNYTNGPAPLIGTATKIAMSGAELDEGWLVDEAPGAQHMNHVLNHITQWTTWVEGGSNVADADAHIVETDSIGAIRAVHVYAGGHQLTNAGLGWFGDGSDGTSTVASGTINLARDMYYQGVSWTGTVTVNTNGFRIFCRGTFLMDDTATVQHRGGNGGNATGSAVGASGAAAAAGTLAGGTAGAPGFEDGAGVGGTANSDAIGGSGGAGGATTGVVLPGGTGGVATAPAATDGGYRHLFAMLGLTHGFGTPSGPTFLRGGAGGGSGASVAAGGFSGGAGGGAGVICIFAENVDLQGGTITVQGGNAGTSAGAVETGGSGGGGGGGILMACRTFSNTGGTVTAAGGTATNGINGGGNGVAGSAGTIIQLTV